MAKQELDSQFGASEKKELGKKVAIVQSSYIPWKGYFDLINMVDEFILFDDMQYTRRDWRNRNKIKTHQGLFWLTIPVLVKGKFYQRINETVVSNRTWNQDHWKTISQSYARAQYFDDYGAPIEELYLNNSSENLSEINHRFLSGICSVLGITTKLTWSSEYELASGKTERLVDLCKQAGATEYISGPNAKGYLDSDLFEEAGILLTYIDYSNYPEYSQLYPPFEHSVSIIDLIFNTGQNFGNYMLSFGVK